MDIHKRFKAWYKDRVKRETWVVPNAPDALMFLITEVGEAMDEYLRARRQKYLRAHVWRGHDLTTEGRAERMTKELCDVVCMVMATALALNADMDEALEKYLEEERA